MKMLMIPILLLTSISALAAESGSYTRSAGKYQTDQGKPLEQRLNDSTIMSMDAAPRPRLVHGTNQETLPHLAARHFTDHATTVEFSIFDASTELSSDLDGDGYYSRINVVFDADVNTELETVYARLYLSRDGGDWQLYATSDLFEIVYDDTADTYEVTTELIEGYPPGYYDVLIELHALNYEGTVASRIVQQDEFGDILSLEDSSYDEPPVVETVTTVTTIESRTTHTSGGGSISIPGLILYGFLVWVKLRYFPSRKNRRA